MILQPNTKLGYKDGKRRITVWLQNVSKDDNYPGDIYFTVNIKQASKSFSGGDGYVNPETHQVTELRYGGMQEFINKAIAAN